MQGPSGVTLAPKDATMECLATRKTSALRSCITQGLGDALCSPLAGLLGLNENSKGHFSLADGLTARGLPVEDFVGGVVNPER
jgi:hypothetical protein